MPLVFIAMLNRVKDQVIFDARVGEEGLEAIVVLLQNRIELMIVAAGASVCHAEKRRACDICDVVQQLLTSLHQIARVAFIGKVPVEAGGD